MKSILLTILILFLITPAGFTAEEVEKHQLIQDFEKAVQSKDDIATRKAWAALDEKPEIVDFMKENLPRHHYLYKSYGLLYRSEALQKQSGIGTSVSTPQRIADTEHRRRTGDKSNNTKEPTKRISNKKLVDRFPLRLFMKNRTSNQEKVRSNPNQNRPPNRVKGGRR